MTLCIKACQQCSAAILPGAVLDPPALAVTACGWCSGQSQHEHNVIHANYGICVYQGYMPAQVFAIGAATVMAQRPSLDASQLVGSGVINLSRVSKFQPAADGARSGTDAAAAAARDGSGAGSSTAREAGSSAGSGAAETGRIEFAAEHAAVEAAEAAKSAAAQAESREEAAHAGRDAAAAAEPPEWLIRGLTRELQHELGLQLFNYDLLCPVPGAEFES